MDISINGIPFDDIFDRMYEMMCEEFGIDTEEKQEKKQDSQQKPNVNYVYKEKNDSQNKSMSSETVKKLEEIIRSKDKEITRLTSENAALQEAALKVNDSSKAVSDANRRTSGIVRDKISADGYRIMNDIKVWTEFARKAGLLDSNEFKDMLEMIKKTLSCMDMRNIPVC